MPFGWSGRRLIRGSRCGSTSLYVPKLLFTYRQLAPLFQIFLPLLSLSRSKQINCSGVILLICP